MPNIYVLLAVAFLCVTGSSLVTRQIYVGKIADVNLQHTKQLRDQETEANRILMESKDAARDQYVALQGKFNTMEGNYVQASDRINGLRLANGRLVAAAGGLYDRNGRATGGQGGSDRVPGDAGSAAGAAGAAAGCQLSGTITQDLLDLARDADLTLAVARLGQAYATAIKEARK